MQTAARSFKDARQALLQNRVNCGYYPMPPAFSKSFGGGKGFRNSFKGSRDWCDRGKGKGKGKKGSSGKSSGKGSGSSKGQYALKGGKNWGKPSNLQIVPLR
eukprot:5127992-Alexandrium_andersonii.AAC.1